MSTTKRLLRSTLLVSSLTFISRVLGLLREVVFANVFGASAGMDAFLVAFKIPNFLRRLFAEGAFSQAFVPVLSQEKEHGNRQHLKELIAHVAGTLALIVFVVALIGMLASSLFIWIFAPGFSDEPAKFELASHLLRITFPYIVFISLTALAGGVLNCFSRFSVPALTPVLLNVSLILASLFLAPYFHQQPVVAVAWGVLIAGAMQFLLQLPFLCRLGVLSWPRWGWRHPGVRRLLKLMIPALFGASVVQLSLLLDTIFASFLKTGSVSWLYYSDRLMQFPLGVFGVALSTVVLPHLSTQYTKQDNDSFNKALDWAQRMVVIIGLPASAGLMLLSGPLLATLFQHGQFNRDDVLMSQQSLIAFSLGIIFFIWVKVLVSAFYSRQKMKAPVKIATIAMISNLLLNAMLIGPLAHTGLALATSLSAMINGGLLFLVLYRTGVYQPQRGWWLWWLRVAIATGTMSLIIWLLQAPINTWFQWSTATRVWHLLLLVVLGKAVYCIVLYALGIRRKHLSP